MTTRWGTASPRLTELLTQLSANPIYKAAANVEAAQMLNQGQDQGQEQGGMDAGPGPTMNARPEMTMADQLRQLAEMEPDMAKKQVMLSAADNLDHANAPVVAQEPPPETMNPAQNDPRLTAQDPRMAKAAKESKEDDSLGEVVWDSEVNPLFDKYAGEMSEEDFLATLR